MSTVFREGEAVYWLRRSGKTMPAIVLKLQPRRVLIRLEVGDHKTRKHVLPRNLRRRDVRSLTALIIGLLDRSPTEEIPCQQ
jgi:hypothetical protein